MFSLCGWVFSDSPHPADELSLAAIDELISRSDYNGALKALAGYQRAHPDDFDAAQKRVEKIMRERQRFNRMARELVERMEAFSAEDSLQNSQDDEKVQIIGAMEKIDAARTEESVALTNDARRTLTLQYYITRATENMNEGARLVAAGLSDAQCYARAAQAFARCLSLKTAETDVVYDGEYAVPVAYAASVLDAAGQVQKKVAVALDALPGLLAACDEAFASLGQAVEAQDVEAALSQLPLLEDAFRPLLDLRDSVAEQGVILANCDRAILSEHPTLVSSFISFMRLAIDGVKNSDDTGIVRALDSFLQSRLEKVKELVFTTCEKEMAAASEVFAADFAFVADTAETAVPQAQKGGSRAASFSRLGSRLSVLWNQVESLPTDREYAYTMDFVSSFWQPHFNRAADDIALLSRTTFEHADTRQLLSDMELYDALRKRTVEARASRQLALESPWADSLSCYALLLDAITAECSRRLDAGWLRIAASYEEKALAAASGFEERVAAAENLSGKNAGDEPAYPSRAARSLEAIAADLALALPELSGYEGLLSRQLAAESAAPPASSLAAGLTTLAPGSHPAFLASHAAVKDGMERLFRLQERIPLSLSAARERAESARLEASQGDGFLSQAQKALSREDYDGAVDFLLRAREHYSSSLSLEYDEDLQKRSDAALLALDGEITGRQHLAIVEKVRTLKTRARQAYYEQDFSTAELRLLEAAQAWAKTSAEEDSEIQDLLELVNNALSMSAERVIPVSAPQYGEMSSLLSLARLRFNEGAALLQQKKPDEAKAAFSQATEHIRKVQRLYPLNREAGLLTLRMAQLLQPAGFEKDFAAQVKKALASKDKKAAYAQLSDLYAINPAYPQLAKQIENLEYELGIRVRPVDTSTKKKSQALVSAAEKALRSAKNDREKLKSVLESVDSALAADPDNAQAMRLKDSVQVALGPQVTNVLSSEDERIYLVAIQELNNNNIIRSYTMIEQLMQKSNNSSNRKLQQLMKRIRALL